jgi:hypothetical protein
MKGDRNESAARRGTRPANRVVVAILLNGFVVFGVGRGAAETGDSFAHSLAFAYSQPAAWTWTALILVYCGLSPVVLPEVVARLDRTRPPTIWHRIKAALFHWVFIWGLVVLAGATTAAGAAETLSRCATAPVMWLCMAVVTVYCLISPVVFPVLWEEEKDGELSSGPDR